MDAETATYFVFRRILVPTSEPIAGTRFPFWRRALFAFLHRRMVPWWKALRLTEDRVVEISVHECL